MVPLSIVLAAYNAEQHLVQCLDSILGQTFHDFELICVDDGSDDGTPQILSRYAKRDGRVSIVTQPNQGVSAARNAGLDAARGEYILFLDADDYFEPTYFEKAYLRAQADGADMVLVRYRYVRDGGTVLAESPGSLRIDLFPERVPFAAADAAGSLFQLTTPAPWNKMLRRRFLLDQGLRFDPSLTRAEDVAFTYSATMLAERISAVDETMINYRAPTGTSVQGTIHVDPTAICRALLAVRMLAAERGLIDWLDRDLVNASLSQCVFTLRSLKSAEAAGALFKALQERYLAELGIAGHAEDYFYSRKEYGWLEKIEHGTFEQYWGERLSVPGRSDELTLAELITDTRWLVRQDRDVSYDTAEKYEQLQQLEAKRDALVRSRLYQCAERAVALVRAFKPN